MILIFYIHYDYQPFAGEFAWQSLNRVFLQIVMAFIVVVIFLSMFYYRNH